MKDAARALGAELRGGRVEGRSVFGGRWARSRVRCWSWPRVVVVARGFGFVRGGEQNEIESSRRWWRFAGRDGARTGDAGLEGGGSAHEGGGAGLGTGRLGGEHGAGHGVHGDDGHGDDLFCVLKLRERWRGEWVGERGDRGGRARRTRARGVKTSLRRVSLEVDDDRRRRRGARRARLGRDRRPRPRSSSSSRGR